MKLNFELMSISLTNINVHLYYKRTTIHHTDLKGIHHVVEHEFIIQLQCAQGAILPIEIQIIYVVLNKVAK